MVRAASTTVLALILGLSPDAIAQRRGRPDSAGAVAEPVVVTISAKIGRKSYQASGTGQCHHTREASTGGLPASLWKVQFVSPREAGLQQLSLTLWRLKDGGPDQLSLRLDTRSGSHRIETGGKGKDVGEGSVTILPNGPGGGRLEITGKDGRRKAIQLAIDCPAFAAVEAEGG
jgi:hypothetical protein